MKNIIDSVERETQLSTLKTALEAAQLVKTLSDTGPFTVFAPNNEAFAKLNPDTLTALLADQDALTAILTYHVVEGTLMSGNLVQLSEATTVNGRAITIDTTTGVKINNAKVLNADIECNNGVVHVIDTVLMPE